jgi:hypothetical protein
VLLAPFNTFAGVGITFSYGDAGTLAGLAGLALAVGTGIELLQWALPLGRVVSPLDAVLNATGAVAVGLLVTRARTGGPGKHGTRRLSAGSGVVAGAGFEPATSGL